MQTLRGQHPNAIHTRPRRRTAVLSGVVTVAASTTVPFVLRLSRRCRDGEHAEPQQHSEYGIGFDQHTAQGHGRPIAWIVVAVIVAGTCASGISLILAAPWLFWTGVGVVIGGIVLGRVTHAMRDEKVPLSGEAVELRGIRSVPSWPSR